MTWVRAFAIGVFVSAMMIVFGIGLLKLMFLSSQYVPYWLLPAVMIFVYFAIDIAVFLKRDAAFEASRAALAALRATNPEDAS